MFLDIECFGIKENEGIVYDEFENRIWFNGEALERFNLHKFVTNTSLLSCHAESLEQDVRTTGRVSRHKAVEEDKGYTRDILGDKKHTDGEQKIIGVRWNFI